MLFRSDVADRLGDLVGPLAGVAPAPAVGPAADGDVGPTTAEIYALGSDDSAVTSRLAAAYREGERPASDAIAPAAGNTADEQDVETTERRLEVTATWRAETDGE